MDVPLDMLSNKINELSQFKQSYVVFCRTGNRSPMAADMLLQSGIHAVKVMEGGITRWQKEGLPFIKGQGGVSLERQVRIIAGSLFFWNNNVRPYTLDIYIYFSICQLRLDLGWINR